MGVPAQTWSGRRSLGLWPEDRDKAPTRQQMDDEYARHSADVAKQIKDLETELMEAPGEIASV